jgi:integrase
MLRRGRFREGYVVRYKSRAGLMWRIRYRDASGRRTQETLGPEPAWTEKRARQELRNRMADVAREGYRVPPTITFAEFAQRWLRDHLPARGLKHTTVETYRYALEGHLLPFFGKKPLSDISPESIDRYVAVKMREGLAPKTVNNQLLTLRVMLTRAVRWRLLPSNPVADAERPRLAQPDMRVLTEEEIAQLWRTYEQLESEADERHRPWWRLARTITFVALGTAMRRGELLALRWREVSMLEGLIHVREALVRGRFTSPKSRASRRLLEVGERTLELLQDHWQTSTFQGEDELVFCHPKTGRPLDPSRLSRAYLKLALRKAGVAGSFRPFHDLRHTALTHEAAAGNPQAYVQMRAGHSQGAITERYIHAAQVLFPGAAQRGEDRLFGELELGKPRQPSTSLNSSILHAE